MTDNLFLLFLLKVEVAVLFVVSSVGYRFDYPLLSNHILYIKKLSLTYVLLSVLLWRSLQKITIRNSYLTL